MKYIKDDTSIEEIKSKLKSLSDYTWYIAIDLEENGPFSDLVVSNATIQSLKNFTYMIDKLLNVM